MINNKPKTLLTLISCIAAAVSFTAAAHALPSDSCTIDIISDNQKIVLENEPFIENDEIYLPIRELTNTLDSSAAVDWNDGTVTIHTKENDYLFVVGEKSVSINPSSADDATYFKLVKNAAVLKNDRTFVPYSLAELIFNNPTQSSYVNYAVYDNAEQYEKTAAWANALMTRDGKPRYEMMTEKMKEKFAQEQKALINSDDWNFTIGYSSPKTVSYNITAENGKSDITYYQADQTDTQYILCEQLTFTDDNGSLYVSDYSDLTDAENNLK